MFIYYFLKFCIINSQIKFVNFYFILIKFIQKKRLKIYFILSINTE